MKKTFGALILGLAVSTACAADVVTIALTPDPRIEKRLNTLDSSERDIAVAIARSGSSETKELQVKVRGPISDEDVQALVQAVLARDESFWSDRGAWDVSVGGDAEYAAVRVSMYCGDLCGSGATYTYGRAPDRWKYLYRSNQWIS